MDSEAPPVHLHFLPNVCFCGHVEDDHKPGHECEVEGCLCAMFEEDEPDD